MLAYTWSCSVVELQNCDLFDFTMDARRIEVSLSQDKISFINSAFQKELDYWKEAALERALDLNDANELSKRLSTSKFIIDSQSRKECKKD